MSARSTKDMLARLENILDLKAQGWSDRQIQKDLKIEAREFAAALKNIHMSQRLKLEALQFVMESVHRLAWLRRRMVEDYDKYRKGGHRRDANGVLRHIVTIDTAVPAMCDQLGWGLAELDRHLNKRKGDKTTDISVKSDDDLYREYTVLVKSKA